MPELWSSSLREVKAVMRPLFSHERVAASANGFVDGLPGDERRKTGSRRQAIPGSGRWDADALRDVVRDYAIEHLGTDDAVPVIDEAGFPKQGKASCGVGHRYTGSTGKVTNCQIGVFAA